MERAGICLDYVRTVKFGETTAAYSVKDGDYWLDITVRVVRVRPADRAQ